MIRNHSALPEPPAKPEQETPERDKDLLDLPLWAILLTVVILIGVLLVVEKIGVFV